MVKIHKIKAKQILQKTKIPDADYVINHYVGCEHACIYCYARFVCRWRKGGEKWGEFVDVKVNAPELVKKESLNKKGSVILCSVSDAYQPIEKHFLLTRRVLENLNKDMTLIILTKSDLVTRDIDLFKEFKEKEIGLTITTLDKNVKKVFEPNSPSSERRIKALKKLKDEGLKTYAFIGPILPYLTDLKEIIEEVHTHADVLMFEDLNMSVARENILNALKENFPELLDKYQHLSKSYWLEKQKEILALGKKYNKPVRIYFKHTGSLNFK